MNPANRVLIRFLSAREFSDDDALQQYFKEHPKAKKELHWVKEKRDRQKMSLILFKTGKDHARKS